MHIEYMLLQKFIAIQDALVALMSPQANLLEGG